MIGEYDANGNSIQGHIYLGDKPVAVVQGGSAGTVDNVTTDQLNSPKIITDASKNVVWRWNSDPFGNGQPTGSLTYNLRFPGQYYDAETGHNYNYFRDYDPGTGRYVESDPIGLKGGVDSYVYSQDNPLSWSDRYGLCPGDCQKCYQTYDRETDAAYVPYGKALSACKKLAAQMISTFGRLIFGSKSCEDAATDEFLKAEDYFRRKRDACIKAYCGQ